MPVPRSRWSHWSARQRRLICPSTALAPFILLFTMAFQGSVTPAAVPGPTTPAPKFSELFERLPPIERHLEGVTEDEAVALQIERENYRQLMREKVQGNWFAALVSTEPQCANQVQVRFETWKGFLDFVLEREAIVDLWAYGEDGYRDARRVPATEVASLRRQNSEQPLFVTLTYREAASGNAVIRRVEFGFAAAEIVLAAQEAYSQQRTVQATATRILSTQGTSGKFDALSQWSAMQEEMQQHGLAVANPPPRPVDTNDVFVAVEYEVNAENYVTGIWTFWRESEVRPQVQREPDGTRDQLLTLGKKPASQKQVRAFRHPGVGDELEPVRAPLYGQESIELRVVDPAVADPRGWHVLEFGEPALLRQAAIAEFSLVNAFMEKRRKEVALTRSKLDLYVEPIFAGLNIGCGATGVPFPVGAAARLGYNAVVTPLLIPPVPSMKQMRDLVRLLAAKEQVPELKTKPTAYLDEADYKELKRRAASIPDAELQQFLSRIQDEDIRAMLRLARMAHWDAELTNLLNILAGAAKVSGWSDEPGLQRDLLNSVYFSVNGEINLKNLIAVAAGARNATPLSGVPLEDLANGKGPLLAWLQYLDVTVDVRAVANTVSRLMHSDLADKELKMPFPYATRMSDIAAYEIRIFGYPTFIYYKRGLMKADYEAFQNDYAYGLITTKIVEHFRTREEMDAEIRAGRMMPLGFVKVPDPAGGWKESNLAVFAHRIHSGKYEGKTAIIIYGLKAYSEQSQLMVREYRRLKQYEQALEEGGTIEQLVEAEPGRGVSSKDFEPVIRVGSNVPAQVFSPLLGHLLEWRRHLRRAALRLPETTAEQAYAAEAQKYLEGAGVDISDQRPDPLLGVDKYNSAVLYRKRGAEGERVYRLVSIPSRVDIVRELNKALEAQRIEELRRRCISPDGEGIALVNEARYVGGRYEMGPLKRDEKGGVDDTGVRAGGAALNQLLAFFDHLPVQSRADIQAQDFASVLVSLPRDGNSSPEKVFLTIEFPVGRPLERTVTNAITGDVEVHTFEDGHLVRTITARSVVELNYNDAGTETGTKVFVNDGTISEPKKGVLLELSRTVDVWQRSRNAHPDAYEPRLRKLRANYITGALNSETYGAFTLPVTSTDELYVISNRFNPYGIFAGSTVFDNAANGSNGSEGPLQKVVHPTVGRARFEVVSTLPPQLLAAKTDARSTGYRTTVRRHDLLKGLSREQVFDNAGFGRCISESWTDVPGGGPDVNVRVTREYDQNFHFGLIPKSTRIVAGEDSELVRTTTTGYDPVRRKLTALEQDHTGAMRTKVWDYRWESPVIIEVSGRRTELGFNSDETTQTSTTVAVASGEEIARSSGQFDPRRKIWRIGRTHWYRPGITNRAVVELRSPYGMLSSVQVGSNLLTRVFYNSGGIEQSNCLFRLNPATAAFDLLERAETDYAWKTGRRRAKVQTFVEGRAYDQYETLTDEHGRIVEDAIRQIGGVRLATRVKYDDVTERVALAEQLQDGEVRLTRQPLREQEQTGGTWHLPVAVSPRWGLVSTQVFVIGDPLARPVSNRLENGDQLCVRQWCTNSGIARESELVKPDGRVVERFETELNAGTEGGIPYDLTRRYRVSFWGQHGLAAKQGFIRGTDQVLFEDVGGERICFDLRKSYRVPLFGIDSSACSGVNATVLGLKRTNVLSLFRVRLEEKQAAGNFLTNGSALLHVERADVRGFFFHRITEQTFDRSGRLLEETLSRSPNAGCYSEQQVFDSKRMTLARFKPEYQPGWMFESIAPDHGGRFLAFTNRAPPAAARNYRVNEGQYPDTVTETEGKVFGSTGESEAARFRDFFFRRIHEVRFLERNPHMPDMPDCWSASTRTDFRGDGSPLFNLELIFDAQGRLRVESAVKQTGSGVPGTRIAYQVVEPEEEPGAGSDLLAGTNTFTLSAGGQIDFSGSDFLYVYSSGIEHPQLIIGDNAGRVVTVRSGDSSFRSGLVPFWRIHPMHVRWLPDDFEPRQGTELLAPVGLQRSGRLLCVSVHDLARASINVSALRSFQLAFSNSGPAHVSFSAVHALNRLRPLIPDMNPREYHLEELHHSSGLTTVITAEQSRSDRDFYTGQKMDALIEFNGLPVATARTRGRLAGFAHLLWLDSSDPDLARPLYAVSALDGQFLEYYQMLRPGDAHLYVAPQTFEVPRLEIYRAGVLQDELYPGVVRYGRDYRLSITSERAGTLRGRAGASLRQRVEANPFNFGAGQLAQQISRKESDQGVRQFNYLRFQQAETRAREISQQPTAAEVLVSLRELPWRTNETGEISAVPVDWKHLRLMLSSRHRSIQGSYAKGLIPTSPDTESERFVDTEKEADLIVLAVKLGELALADELLEFYREASHGGQEPLLSSYDAQSGTGLKRDVKAERPGQSQPTAGAQLAVAEATFYLGFAASPPSSERWFQTNRTRWLSFGRELLRTTMREFRSRGPAGGMPRGVAEFPVNEVEHRLGVAIWPDAEVYSLSSNARAYLLLKRLLPLALERFRDPEWRVDLAADLAEQEAFLRKHVLPEVERAGVVPSGLFEIQDVEQESSAIAVQRWTTVEDWLAFLEAARELGVPEQTCRQWLENLARVHGVCVNSVWGLDWRLAVLRHDAISPELTARFLRVARRLNYPQAEVFAARNLDRMRREDVYPVAITAAPRDHALTGGKDYSVLPWIHLRSWPRSLLPFRHLREVDDEGWDLAHAPAQLQTAPAEKLWPQQQTDRTAFVVIAAGVYALVLFSALFWWVIRKLRPPPSGVAFTDQIVPEPVMLQGEERWAKRVLGMTVPAGGEYWRISNAPVEENFLTQLRAAYKLVLEWRRLENGWEEGDPRLVEHSADPWLNGIDEFAVLIGIYMRSVIKAGAKDGFAKADVLAEHEDSNHIWARLTLFFSEHLWSLGAAVHGWQRARGGPEESDYHSEILETLGAMGVRQRTFSFDARELFNYPANQHAMDLLIIQDPGRTLEEIMSDAALKLDIPTEHIRKVVKQYKEFKARERTYPIHPYLVEFAKEMPHFVLMGLGAIVAYNQAVRDSSIVEYLKGLVAHLALTSESLLWGVPLAVGMGLTVLAHLVRAYRFEAAIRPREKPTFWLDATVTSLFTKRHEAEPQARTGRWRDPNVYERWGWVLRALGYLVLALDLLRVETPSFGTFFVVKGIFSMLALAEVAGVILPLLGTAFSKFIQDHAHSGAIYAFLNRLNITATRPASPLWLSIKYHAQPSIPTGTRLGLAQAIAFYFLLAAAFFFGGIYLCQQILPLWFTETYLQGSNLKLLAGGVVFGVTMFLLRYGIFLLFTCLASLMAAFPVLSIAGFLAVAQILFTYSTRSLELEVGKYTGLFWGATVVMVTLGLFENRFAIMLGRRKAKVSIPAPESIPAERRLAVVYMSGDDLSALKLTPEVLMDRWTLMRDKLDSKTLGILAETVGRPDDEALKGAFRKLFEVEQAAGVTLWHPVQLQCRGSSGSAGRFNPELGLHVAVADEKERQQVIGAWHLRRWLACMMSTGGHSQDTGVNLVDVAMGLDEEGLSRQVAFYLIQNKYDNSANNRPSQGAYDRGEAAQRNKLARLLCTIAPGAKAYCIQNWTPFGFKAGGLHGMDLVYEESLQLSNMLLLDRNATVHDLKALMLDIRDAMADPNLVIVIPGRSTTNTLTPIGQGSQLVEEGHRSYLRGILSVLGGSAGEAVGTGWGNLVACFYGSAQRALVSARGRKMALTSRMLRGTSFAERTEGLIGFGPHAVGISEDIWAVVQAMNTALGLGLRPRFALSRAIWHKLRETWSHAEWLSSFPRWAGGYYQMLHDPLMQRIYDFGPQSVFARELRSNSGRTFLSAPIALLSILLMPLAIIFDVSPFVQTLVVLWNCGFVLNQVLTLHALTTYIESCGFNRITAVMGAVLGGAWAQFSPAAQPYGPGLVLIGMLLGGFFVGFSRWLVTRVRDLILFGPQLIMHALAQAVRLSLEFIVSGTSAEDARHVSIRFRACAGPREDRPLENYPGFINLRTVVWGFGLLSLSLCLIALIKLDMLNVLLLLPSLLFSISTLAGPFLMAPAAGHPLGFWSIVPRALGWMAAGLFYCLISFAAAEGRMGRWLSVWAVVIVFGVILWQALKYFPFRYRLRRRVARLRQLLEQSGADSAKVPRICSALLQTAVTEPARPAAVLERSGIAAAAQPTVLEFVNQELIPFLRAPVLELKQGLLARSRWAVDWTRAFIMGLLVLLWFMMVPVPGLMVFTAGSHPESYRFTLALGSLARFCAIGVAVILLSGLAGRLIQWIELHGRGRKSLRARFEHCLSQLKEMTTRLTGVQTARGFALLTDAQVYIDQRSYAYAKRSIAEVEHILAGQAPGGQAQPGHRG